MLTYLTIKALRNKTSFPFDLTWISEYLPNYGRDVVDYLRPYLSAW
jgi:hypothetical protein